jgi:hypothetical protein
MNGSDWGFAGIYKMRRVAKTRHYPWLKDSIADASTLWAPELLSNCTSNDATEGNG